MERKPRTEEAEIAEIIRGVLAVQARSAAEENRTLRRATHAKGVCARAVFEVLDVAHGRDPMLAARLAKGLFAKPGFYAATVRFANGDSGLNTDWTPDVRALSFCVELGFSGTSAAATRVVRQDYSLQSWPTLPMNDVHAFCVFAKVLQAPNPTIALAAMPFHDQLVYAHTMIRIMAQTRHPVLPYQHLRYWSNVPFRHGSEDVVKYSASPAARNAARAFDFKKRDPNALSTELIRHLNEDDTMSSFDFGVQFLDTESMSYQGARRDATFWIENAAVEWPETQSPFHTVARLTLLPRSQLSEEESEAMYIDVTTNSMADSVGVGGINRARWYGEIASRNARLGKAQPVYADCSIGERT
jgi:catalase